MSASQFARPPHINSGFLKIFHLLYSILSSLVNEDWFKTHTFDAMASKGFRRCVSIHQYKT
jgi:hypothetical protein